MPDPDLVLKASWPKPPIVCTDCSYKMGRTYRHGEPHCAGAKLPPEVPENGITPEQFMDPTQAQREALYLIECLRHGYSDLRVWWRAGQAGYTKYVDEAGYYTYDQARKITNAKHWNDDKPWIATSVGVVAKRVVLR